MTARVQARMAGFDGLVHPTLCFAPPPLAELEKGEEFYVESNLKSLRNTTPGNFFGLCGLTLPCGMDSQGLPVGLLLTGLPRTEGKILRLGQASEDALAA
jgi:aspartyl-tRNA(Asn)/glutamyl-tRNA(Gln) amidotransferase subunit A